MSNKLGALFSNLNHSLQTNFSTSIGNPQILRLALLRQWRNLPEPTFHQQHRQLKILAHACPLSGTGDPIYWGPFPLKAPPQWATFASIGYPQ